MPGPLKKLEPFKRRSRRLPGQSETDEELGVSITFKVNEGSGSATVINEELIIIGNQSAGRYVQIDATGLKLFIDETGIVQMQFYDGQDEIGKLYTQVDSNTSIMTLYSLGKDASNHEASVAMQAITDDGAAHAGAASTVITAETEYDRITLGATYTFANSLRLTPITTTQRDALTPLAGMIIYNTTTNKFQGYISGAWSDLY